MDILTLDFETYYSTEYSLSKISPAEYVLDPRFECTGLAVKRGRGQSFWVEGDRVQEFFDNQPEDVMCVTHNALFDMCIAAWQYGWVPKIMVDTLGVSRSILQAELKSLSLNNVAKHLGLGQKTGALANVKNMRLAEIRAHPELYQRFIEYGLNDADLCFGIFERLVMSGQFPASEIAIMDSVLRCAVEPQFKVNIDVLNTSLATIKQKKEETLTKAMLLGAEGKSALMSNEQFADLLRQHGVEPPIKISGATGKPTYAFAKSDQDFIDLQEHPDPAIQTLVAARLGHKSTIEESRHERFIAIANLNWPKTKRNLGGYQRLMPMPLRFGGAHTHRLSGDWKLNVQNMGRGSMLRQSLEAPDGCVVIAGDESQIEARFVCTLCGQEDMRQQFEDGEDVYSLFATDLFMKPVTKTEKIERFIGKQCLGPDTMVLTDQSWLPITYLTTEHKVWDGTEWVTHQGLLDQGVQEVQTAHGLTMTGDHEILTEHGWQAWSEVHTNLSLFQSALEKASLPLPAGVDTTGQTADQPDGNRNADAHVGKSHIQTGVTCLQGEQPDATRAPKLLPVQNDTGNIKTPCQTTNTELDYSTDCRQRSQGATTRLVKRIPTTGGEELPSAESGEKTGLHSSNMCKPSPDGTTLPLKLTGKTSTKVTSEVTSGLPQSPKTWQTNGELTTSKSKSLNSRQKSNVYDLANCGPRNRFTVQSDNGPLIVHNCILGLGYGLGKDKFSASIPVLAWNQMGIKLDYTLEEGTKAVNFYRTKNHNIKKTWELLNTRGIHALYTGEEWAWGPVVFRKEEIVLPNGMKLYYRNLRQQEGGRFGFEWVFDYGHKTKRAYGGMLLENITQALARIIVMEASTRIRKTLTRLGIPLALQVHDELVFVVKKEYENVVRKVLEYELRRRPTWLPNLPLDCETGVGPNYGDAK
jgi:hypothetical protein